MEPKTSDNGIDPAPTLTIHGPEGDYRYQPVPPALAYAFAPATHVLYEWIDYRVTFPGATHLEVGSHRIPCFTDGVFQLTFENRLGITELVPYCDGAPIGPPRIVEVIARKFRRPAHSYDFLRGTLRDLFAKIASIPFAARTTTGRRVRAAHRPPDVLFTYHFFRANGPALICALQAIAGRPHQRLSDEGAMVRVHEARSLDAEAITRLLTDGRGGVRQPGSGTSVLDKLQPERIFQRLPEETFDTPENRFVIFAARRMLHALIALQSSRWFADHAGDARERAVFDVARKQLRLFTTDRRLASLPPLTFFPTQSRVLQRRDGYRELMGLWNVFQRASEPVFERLSRAIDLRDVASMYELWVWFDLVEAITAQTGITPSIDAAPDELTRVEWGQVATFPGVGALHYNRRMTPYSSGNLRPDCLWERVDGSRIALDAKFRLDAVDDLTTGNDEIKGKAGSGDILTMHAYRDALPDVTAAIVIYPGSETRFWPSHGEVDHGDMTIANVIAGDLHGVGALPRRPVALADPSLEDNA